MTVTAATVYSDAATAITNYPATAITAVTVAIQLRVSATVLSTVGIKPAITSDEGSVWKN